MAADSLRVAIAQMNSGEAIEPNLNTISRMIHEAAEAGADLVAFPENATSLCPASDAIDIAEPNDGHVVQLVREMARTFGIAVLLGSFHEICDDDHTRVHNTSVVVNKKGNVVGTYRKVHLFDVDVAADTAFRESDMVRAGEPGPVVVEIDGWKLGLSICYDLRFPEHYRALVEAGAEIMAVPSAFTLRTGADHWHTLLRARAIENQCFVIAPAQIGSHYGRRESYGHALAYGPWGHLLGEEHREHGLLYVTLDRASLDDARQRLPSLKHRRC